MAILRTAKIYFQISPSRVVARNLDTGVEATDSEAAAFRHPRSIVSDFALATSTLQKLMREVAGNSFLRPKVVMHWMPKLEGGPSEIEKRVLQELGTSAGAREVLIFHTNDPLPDDIHLKIKTMLE